MNNNDQASKEAIRLENLPFSSATSPQYYTSCEENRDGAMDQGQSATTMDEQLLEIDAEAMSLQDTSRWRYAALAVSWVSIVVLLILGILSFICSDATNSSAAFGFGFDCLLDLATSAVVLWRFMGSVGTVHSPEKERIALLFLGALFIIAAVSILARTIPDLISKTSTTNDYWLIILAGVSMLICLGLAISKFVIAKKLKSKSIQSDGYSSLAGAITTLSMLVSSVVISTNRNVWYLDEIIGLIVALLLCCYGIKLLIDVTQSPAMKVACKKIVCCRKSSDDQQPLSSSTSPNAESP